MIDDHAPGVWGWPARRIDPKMSGAPLDFIVDEGRCGGAEADSEAARRATSRPSQSRRSHQRREVSLAESSTTSGSRNVTCFMSACCLQFRKKMTR